VPTATLDRYTALREDLVRPGPGEKVRCVACAHRCALADRKRGVCLVRSREGTSLRVPWGYTAGVAVDPIEKKPFFHVLPGSAALSFGMLGCDLKCAYCQNWLTSQALRDPRALTAVQPTTPEALAGAAVRAGCASVVSTYNEPLITAEWAREVFRAAKARGLLTGFVSNGHATPEVLEYLRPAMDLLKIDLKSMRPAAYRELGGWLEAVLDTIGRAWRMGFWVEVVTLVVPGFNDAEEELREAARFLAGISPDLPWHVTAFHPDYRMADRPPTAARTLARAREIGLEEGLRYVYAGNLPGAIGGGEDTRCPGCGRTLVRRLGFRVLRCEVGEDGRCPGCGERIAGVWRS